MDTTPTPMAGADGTAVRLARGALWATLLVPIVFIPGLLFPYVVPRAVWFRGLVEVELGVILFLLLGRWTAVERKDLFLRGLGVFLLVQLLAAAVGVSPLRSIFGDLDRMWGVYTWFHLALYYVALRTFLRPADWPRFLAGAAGVGAVVAGAAVAAALAEPAALCGAVLRRQGSTLGNPGYLGASMIPVLGMALLGLARGPTTRRGALFALAALLALLALVFSGTRAAVLGVGIGAVVGAVLLGAYRLRAAPPVEKPRRGVSTFGMRTGWGIRAAIAAGAVIAVVLAALAVRTPRDGACRPSAGSGLARDASTVNARTVVWRAGLESAGLRPLLGWGPENERVAVEASRPRRDFPDAGVVWDRVHNAPLGALVTGGVPGLLAFLLLWAAFFRLVWLGRSRGRLTRAEAVVLAGSGLAYLTYLFFWFEDYASFLLMLVLVAYSAARVHGEPLLRFGEPRPSTRLRPLLLAAGLVILVDAFYLYGVRPLWVARLAAAAHETSDAEAGLAMLDRAMALRLPGTDRVLIDATRAVAEAAPRLHGSDRLTATLATAIAATDAALASDPRNDGLHALRADQYATAFTLSGQTRFYREALESQTRAISLSPNRIEHRRSLARLHITGHEPNRALEALDAADEIVPGTPETGLVRAVALLHLDRPAEARAAALAAVSNLAGPDYALVTSIAVEMGRTLGPAARTEILDRYEEVFGQR